MTISELRDRVTLLRASAVTDSLRGQALTWSTLDTVWAAWRDLSSRETLQAQAVHALLSARCTIRARTDVTAQVRVQRKGKTYEIVGPPRDPDGQGVWLELDVVEVP